jgi:hypothetical protein
MTNLQGCIIFASVPVTGNRHDMAKLKGSDAGEILKKASGVFAARDSTGLIASPPPIRKPECRELPQWNTSGIIR